MNRIRKKKAVVKKRAARRSVVVQLPRWAAQFMGTVAKRCDLPIETVVLVMVTAKICALEKQGDE